MNEPTLHIRLLGSLELAWGDGSFQGLPSSATARALLAYLIFRHDSPVPRARLAGLFWPDRSDDRARRALSQALWQIRAALGPAADRLVAEREAVTFEMRDGDWLDVAEFEENVGKYVNGEWQVGDASLAYLSGLGRAAELYRADFLEGVYDDWALLERERLRECYLQALERLITLHKQQGSYEQALVYAQRLSAADPLREEAHRELMQLYHLLGRTQAALEQFATLRDLLTRELGVRPTAATTALYQEISAALAEDDVPHLPIAPSPPPLLRDLSHLPFVGRTGERAALLYALQATARGQGGVALVEGDVGVGKTRLVGEVVAGAEWRGFQVGVAKASSLAAPAPYQLFREALSPLLTPLRVAQLATLVEPVWLSVVAPVLPAISEYLPDLPSRVPLDPDEERRRLWGGLARCLSGLASVEPLLLVFEDVHWADEATLAALLPLLVGLSASRVFIVVTCRAAEARERTSVWETLDGIDRSLPLLRLRLLPFELVETTELLGRALGAGGGETQVAVLAERLQGETGGNALFLVESFRTLLEQEAVTRSPDGRVVLLPERLTLSIPASIQDIIGGRLRRLGTASRAVLELIAVLGEDADFPVLARASDVPPTVLLPALEELKRHGFLLETEARYRFEHDRVREVVYQLIDTEQRLQWHRRVGGVLEALFPERVASLAYHFGAGGRWDSAIDYGQRAGDQARAAYANKEAVAHYTRALEALDRLPVRDANRRYDLLLAREAVYDLQGLRQAQRRDLEVSGDLAEALDDGRKRAAVALRRSDYFSAVSDYPAAEEAARGAIAWAAQAGEPALEVGGHVALGRTAWLQADYAAARAHYERALELVQGLGDRWREADCLHRLGVVHYDCGEYMPAREYVERTLAIFRDLGEPQREAECLNVLANICNDVGDGSSARQYYEQSLAIKRAIGDRYGESVTLYNLGVYYRDLGDGEAARRCCEEALAIGREIGDRRLEAYVLTYLGLILERLHAPERPSEGDLAAGGEYYAQALAIRREIGQLALAVDSMAGLARVALAQGQVAEALDWIVEALEWIAGHGVAGIGDVQLVYLTAYQTFLAADRVDQAKAAIGEAYRLLLSWAEDLPDEDARRALLEDVWPNNEVVALHQALETEAPARRIEVRLPRVGAPTGRPLYEEEWVQATWTVAAPEDDAIPGKVDRRRNRLIRLLREAAEQAAAPTVESLAEALGVNERTIRRDLEALRAAGHDVRTRGIRA